MKHVDKQIHSHYTDLKRVFLHPGKATTLFIQRVVGNTNVTGYGVASTPETVKNFWKPCYNCVWSVAKTFGSFADYLFRGFRNTRMTS